MAATIFPITLAGTTYSLEKIAKLAASEYGRDTLQAAFDRYSGAELSAAPAALKANFPGQPAALGTAAQRAEAKKQFDDLTLERFLTNIMAHPEVVAKVKDLSKGRGGGGAGEEAILAAFSSSSSAKGAHLKGHASLAQQLSAEMARGGGSGGLKTDNVQDLSAFLSGTAALITADPAKAQSIRLSSLATSVEARAVVLFTMVVIDSGLASMNAGSLAAWGFKEKSELAPPEWSLSDMVFPLPSVVFGVATQIESHAERALQRSFFSNIPHLKPASAAKLAELGKKIPGFISGFLRRVERLSPMGDLLPGCIIFFKHLFEEGVLLVMDKNDSSNDGPLSAQITALHLQIQKEEMTRAHRAMQAAIANAAGSSGGGGGGGGGGGNNRFGKRAQDSSAGKKADLGDGKDSMPKWLKTLVERLKGMEIKCPGFASKENWDKAMTDTCIICRPGTGRNAPKCGNKRKCPNVGTMDGGSGKDEVWAHHPVKRYLEKYKIVIPDAGKSPKEVNGDFKGLVHNSPPAMVGHSLTLQGGEYQPTPLTRGSTP